jgi:hypothetical protein
MPLTWLPNRSIESLRNALTRVEPELSSGEISLMSWIEQSNPLWHGGSALLDGSLVAKFAWSEPAAKRVWHEAQILTVLGSHTTPLRTPRVVVASSDPALVVTEFVAGVPLLYDRVAESDRPSLERTGSELAQFLAGLHRPDVLADVISETGPLATPVPQATTQAIRERLSPWIRSDQIALVGEWCDWADGVLTAAQREVMAHGDLHGHNQVWDSEREELRAVVDFGESGPVEAEFDFRYLPSQGPTVDLLVATCAKYVECAGTSIDLARVMAWHLRTVLGDALWRSEARVPLPDGGTPAEWVDALRSRLAELELATS